MKNLENLQLDELSAQEMQETDGGVAIIGIAVGVAVGAYIYYKYFDE